MFAEFNLFLAGEFAARQIESFEQLSKAKLEIIVVAEIEIQNGPQRRFDLVFLNIFDPDGNYRTVFGKDVGRLQSVTFGSRPDLSVAEVVAAEDRDHFARRLQPFVDPRQQVVAGLKFPSVKPDSHARIAQTFCEHFAPDFVFAGVAEKEVVFEILFLVGHIGVSVKGAR
ncbi:MAG: hypothetical protein JMDDDDMK_00560 [Acidobacteria bacterium]|nr:hypothetical protein [Acidobacteriota bacterium]